MADDTEDLQLTISGDASGAEAATTAASDAVAQFITRLEAAMVAGGKMGDGLEAGATKGKVALDSLSAGLKDVEAHSMLVSRGLSAIGLEADAGAVKVGALAGVLGDLGKATGPLLLIGAALAVVTSGFAFLADSVKVATEFEQQMTRIKVALGDQGTAWDGVRDKIEEFIESESRFSGVTQHDLLDAFNSVVVAGHDMADAMKIVTIAEDVHAATGESVVDVTKKIVEAEAGRTRGLLELDPRLKDVIKSHGDMDQILTKLAQDMANQATSAANEYAVSVGKLGAAWDDFKKDVGSWLIPWLNDLVLGIDFVVEAMHNLVTAIAAGKGISVAGIAGETAAQMMARQMAAAGRHQQNTHGVSLDRNVTPTPDTSSSGSTGSLSFTPSDGDTSKVDAYADAQTKLSATLELLSNKSDLAKAHISDATTAQEKQRLEAVAQATELKDLQAQFDALGTAIADEGVAIASDTQKQTAAKTAWNEATYVYNQAGAAMLRNKDASIETANHIADLKAKMDKAKTSYDDLTASIAENTKNQTSNATKLGEVNVKLIEQRDALNKVLESYSEFTQKEKADMLESVQTLNMTTNQKIAYYEKLRDAIVIIDETTEKQAEDLDKKIQDNELESLKARQKAYEDFIKTIQGFEDSFITDITVKHENVATSFKTMLDDMLESYKKWIAQMLVQQTLGPLNKEIASMFGFGGTGGGSGPLGIGSSGGPNGTPGSPLNVTLSPQSIAALTGSTTGIASTLTTGSDGIPVSLAGLLGGAGTSGGYGFSMSAGGAGFGNLGAIAAVSNANAAGGASAGGGILSGLFGGSGSSSGISGALGGILQGAGIGGMVAGLDGGNSTWGSVGGSVGDIAGTVLGGPLGGMIGSALGGLVGSLFGPHWGPATNTPDRSDTSVYGQFLANWQGGNPSVNGQTFNAASQYNTQTGGTPEIDQLEQWAAGLNGSTTGLTPDQLAAYKQVEALMGGNNNANLGIANEHNGMLTLGNGSTITVAQAEAMINNYTAGSGGSAVSPVFTVTHGYPDANMYTSTQTGTYTETGTGTSYLGGGPAATATAGGGAAAGGVTVNLNVSGSLVGSVPNDVVTKLASAVMAVHRGIGSGSGIAPRRPVFN